FPWVAVPCLLKGVVEQRSHVGLVELLVRPELKIGTNAGEMKLHAVSFRRRTDPYRIVDAAVVYHRLDGALRDAEEGALGRRPIRVEAAVANNVGIPLAHYPAAGRFARQLKGLWIKEGLRNRSAVDVHFGVAPATVFDLDQHRREGTRNSRGGQQDPAH